MRFQAHVRAIGIKAPRPIGNRAETADLQRSVVICGRDLLLLSSGRAQSGNPRGHSCHVVSIGGWQW
jgi:hypothetical protein